MSQSKLAENTRHHITPVVAAYQPVSTIAVSDAAMNASAICQTYVDRADVAVHQPVAEQPEQEARDHHRFGDVELGLHQEVNDAEDGDRVDDFVQPVPALTAEALDHAVGRGRGERDQADQRDEADGQIDAQRDFARDLCEIEFLLHEVEREVQHRVAERREPKRAAHVDQLWGIEQAARRRDRERDHDEPYGVVAGRMDRVIDRPCCAQVAAPGAPGEPERRDAGAHERDDLFRGPAAGFFAQERHQTSSAPSEHTEMPRGYDAIWVTIR